MQLFSLGGLLIGVLIGTILVVWGAKKKQQDLAVIGFGCCAFFGSTLAHIHGVELKLLRRQPRVEQRHGDGIWFFAGGAGDAGDAED